MSRCRLAASCGIAAGICAMRSPKAAAHLEARLLSSVASCAAARQRRRRGKGEEVSHQVSHQVLKSCQSHVPALASREACIPHR